MKVKLLVEGGQMQPGPTIAQQLGPLGLNIGNVIADINKATKSFEGTKVPVELDINVKTKTYDILVSLPPVAELIKKELSLEKGSGESNKVKIANASIEHLIKVAQTKLPNLLAKDLKAALKLVVGTCTSLGIIVENKTPLEIQRDIEEGKYDKEIKSISTKPSPEKLQSLAEYFAQLSTKQEQLKKAEAEAKAAEEAKKQEAAVTGAAATPTATPDAKAEKKEEKPAKAPAKK
jgi:large subunit ribosomal protein L11